MQENKNKIKSFILLIVVVIALIVLTIFVTINIIKNINKKTTENINIRTKYGETQNNENGKSIFSNELKIKEDNKKSN